VWGAPATLLNFVFLGWFLGREQAGRALIVSIVGNGANVAFDYLFIAHFGWEAAGAGAATALSQYLMLAVALGYARRELRADELRGQFRRILGGDRLRASFQLNGDILVRTLALISVFAFFTNLASTMGTLALAATAVVKQVVTLAAFFIDGFAFATESLAGIFDGSRQRRELRRLLRTSLGWSFATGMIFATGFFLVPRIYRLLTSHREVLDLIAEINPWLFPVLGLGSLAYALDGYFIGLVRGRILSRAMLAAALVGFAPVAWLAWRAQDIHLLWLSLALFMLARVISLAVFVPGTLRESV
jgi:MATE family multidrug resistance protein